MFKLRVSSGKGEKFPRIVPYKQNKIILNSVSIRQRASFSLASNSSNQPASTNENGQPAYLAKIVDKSSAVKPPGTSGQLINSMSNAIRPVKQQSSQTSRSTANNGNSLAQLVLTSTNNTAVVKPVKTDKVNTDENDDSSYNDSEQSNFTYDCNCILCATRILKRSKEPLEPFSKTNENWSLDTRKFFKYLDSIKPSLKIDRSEPALGEENHQRSPVIEKIEVGREADEHAVRLLSKSSRIKLWNSSELFGGFHRSLNLDKASNLVTPGGANTGTTTATYKLASLKRTPSMNNNNNNNNNKQLQQSPAVRRSESLAATHERINNFINSNYYALRTPMSDHSFSSSNRNYNSQRQNFNNMHVNNSYQNVSETGGGGEAWANDKSLNNYNNPPTTPDIPTITATVVVTKSKSFRN
jgi:hypothetical protein